MAKIRHEITIQSAPETLVKLNTNKYSGTVSYYFEVVGSGSNPAYTALQRNGTSTNDATVNHTSGTTIVRSRVTLSPPAGETTYRVASTGICYKATIIIIEDTTPTNSEIKYPLGSSINTTSTVFATPADDIVYFYYDSSQWDGSPAFYLEAYLKSPTSKSSAQVRLEVADGTGNGFTGWAAVTNSTLSSSSTTGEVVTSSALTLTSGRWYRVTGLSPTSKSAAAWAAHLVIRQTNPTKFVETYGVGAYPNISSVDRSCLTYLDPSEWSSVTRTNTFEAGMLTGSATTLEKESDGTDLASLSSSFTGQITTSLTFPGSAIEYLINASSGYVYGIIVKSVCVIESATPLTATASDSINSFSDAIETLVGIAQSASDSINNWLDDAWRDWAFGSSLNFFADSQELGYGLIFEDNLNNFADAAETAINLYLEISSSLNAVADEINVVLGYEVAAASDLNSFADAIALGYGLLVVDDANSLADYQLLGLGLIFSDDANNLADAIEVNLAIEGAVDIPQAVASSLNSFADAIELRLSYEVALASDLNSFSDAAWVDWSFGDSLNNFADAASLVLGYEVAVGDDANSLADAIEAQLTDTIAPLTVSVSDDLNNWLDAVWQDWSFGDSLTLADAIALQVGYLIEVSDDANSLADAAALNLSYEVAASSDANALTDAVWHDYSFGDSFELTDSASLRLSYELVVASDLNSFSDAVEVFLGEASVLYVTAEEAFSFSDSIIIGPGYEYADSLNLSDECLVDHKIPASLSGDCNNWLDEINLQSSAPKTVGDRLAMQDGVIMLMPFLHPASSNLANFNEATEIVFGLRFEVGSAISLSDSISTPSASQGLSVSVGDSFSLSDSIGDGGEFWDVALLDYLRRYLNDVLDADPSATTQELEVTVIDGITLSDLVGV